MPETTPTDENTLARVDSTTGAYLIVFDELFQRFLVCDHSVAVAELRRFASYVDALRYVVQLVALDERAEQTRTEHESLLDELRTAGHNVSQWADDPSMLRAYAQAISHPTR